MRALCVAFLVACLFPYTQFLPIETYTQPYSVVFGFMLFILYGPRVLETIPRADALVLLGLAFAGLIAFLIGCLPVPNEQELKYLLIYVAPLVLTTSAFAAYFMYPKLSLHVVSAAAVVWLAVGLVQTLVDPSFAASYVGVWQDAAEVVVLSGRGVLGLAPEPTHYGFHLIIVGAVLTVLGGNRVLAWACVIGALLLARSTSSAAALLLGGCIVALRTPFKYKVPIVMAILASPFVVYALLERFDPESSRLLYLAGAFLTSPAEILQIDWSVNVRLGGLIATMRDTLDHFLLPHGLSHDRWMEHSRDIVDEFRWLFALSDAGPPSGFGIVVYQLGAVGIALLVRPIFELLTVGVRGVDQVIVLAAFWVFVGQYFISAPGYSLLYAGVILLGMRLRERAALRRAARPDAPAPPAPAGGLGDPEVSGA
jgi:hypothetical protein